MLPPFLGLKMEEHAALDKKEDVWLTDWYS
jgi:hypothetical protein